ncbi:MAG: hypothetical protein JGK17_29890 [Microcoleus sp. PH2017_10_PVI_O_A]|uniref:hypothetical protein n=1 Tax=unclassified Microcoleus TaxID=2642155 RepID=UPI001E1A4A14|nr:MULTISPECIES: hypothetical protein [unclassified Microcoleus]MCC3409689.1 hypothetical protein [Microcoleus sp. PH2017_10_PVI_O_A]MCC3463954.1 hypothetical protein [Microcoleus sp. PH2017_11_PCY_U_A]MCC3482279.1 hypothetical protein [Microcoleus sp. PH2017_12_PCY_D_A]MCC3563259.1 hypothetical protein [Microcoleus sp. PH2017_27_LUM_O_A]
MATIKGSVTVGGTKFEYAELDYGKNRGIAIWRLGVAKDRHEYLLTPNPHDDPWYNKHQEDFYREAATRIGEIFMRGNPNAYPPFGTKITIHSIDYTLSQY